MSEKLKPCPLREILFRGKRVDNGEWETGSLVYARMGTSEEQASIADKMTAYHTPVIPETVGQYTGLTDKNGKKIFEGDIIKYSHRGINEKAIIKYGAPKERYTMYGWYLDDNHGNTAFLLSEYFIEFYDCVIIGNIFDNPELVEVKEHE